MRPKLSLNKPATNLRASLMVDVECGEIPSAATDQLTLQGGSNSTAFQRSSRSLWQMDVGLEYPSALLLIPEVLSKFFQGSAAEEISRR